MSLKPLHQLYVEISESPEGLRFKPKRTLVVEIRAAGTAKVVQTFRLDTAQTMTVELPQGNYDLLIWEPFNYEDTVAFGYCYGSDLPAPENVTQLVNKKQGAKLLCISGFTLAETTRSA